MSEIDYARLASIMREQNESPRVSMSPNDYYSAQAIHALIHAMEAMPKPPAVSHHAGCHLLTAAGVDHDSDDLGQRCDCLCHETST